MSQSLEPYVAELHDGTRALVRPIEPGDKWRLALGLRLLSPRSRYLRFHAPVDHLSDAQLRYLTEVDQLDHVAVVAVDADRPTTPGMGVARYVRLPREPDVAEAAVTVADAFQGRGLGTVLLGTLVRAARRGGVRVLRNYVLASNAVALDAFAQLGATRRDDGGGVYVVDLPVGGAGGGSPGGGPVRAGQPA